MGSTGVPDALADRLGPDGTEGLVSWVESAQEQWKEEIMTTTVDRFESRLTSEISSLRVDFAREISLFRGDMARDLADVRVELLKWSFLFWVGQVAAMAGLLAFMLRR
jgi:hypothetical protein